MPTLPMACTERARSGQDVRVELSMSRVAWLLVWASLAAVVVALVGAAVIGGSVEVNVSERSTAKQIDACAMFATSDTQTILGPAAAIR